MHVNYVFEDVNEALPLLLRDLSRCDEVGSRAGRTREMTHVGITLTEPTRREILLDHRKPNLAAQIAETMWVLSGRDDMEFLTHYLPRALDFSDDGKTWRAGYGKRLRAWPRPSHPTFGDAKPVDQLAYVVDLLKRDPGTRQAVMSVWDPVIDTHPGKDIPCNDWLHFISRLGYLDLHVALRSNDIIWGWSGINQFEWSTLLEVVAGLTGMKVGSLHFSTTSFHIYDRHWAKADKIVKSAHLPGNRWREEVVKDSPRFQGSSGWAMEMFDDLCEQWFRVEYDIRTGSPMVGHYIDAFPEPMLKSWLIVLDWWWNGRHSDLAALGDTRLEMATHYSVQPPKRGLHPSTEVVQDSTLSDFVGQSAGWFRPTEIHEKIVAAEQVTERASAFVAHAMRTHREKHEAYGDSWKRRGEQMSIMANIARKVDRLGGAETSDETSADTAMDLFVYLAKYLVWLDEQEQGPITLNWGGSDNPGSANEVMLEMDLRVYDSLSVTTAGSQYIPYLEKTIREVFESLETLVTEGAPHAMKADVVKQMMDPAYQLAVFLYNTSGDDYRGADVD